MKGGRRLRSWLIFAGAAGLILAASFFFDAALQDWMTAHRTRGMRNVMRYVSWIGDWWGHAAGGLLALWLAYLRGNRRWVRICIAMLVALAIAGAAARVVKVVAGRARPSVQIDAGFNGPRFAARYHAFPSGHTAATLGFFGVIAFANLRLFVTLLPIPILIGFSRVYLGAHHFSDVVCGAILGGLVALWVAQWRSFEIRPRAANVVSS